MRTETIEQYLHRNLATETADRYLRIITHFIATNKKAKYYQYKDIVNYMAVQRKRYPATGTCNTVLSALKQYYYYLLEMGQRNSHPCNTMRIKRKKTAVQTQNLFTSAELVKLLDVPNRYADVEVRNKLALSLLIYQGLTCQELIKLKVSDVDLDVGIIKIKASSKVDGRTLELHRTQEKLIDSYLNTTRKHLLRIKGLTSTKALLIGKEGTPLTQDGIKVLFRTLKYYYPERVLNATTVRQSVVSNWLNEKGISLLEVQQKSGMKYPSSTEKYRCKDAESQRKLINQYHPLC